MKFARYLSSIDKGQKALSKYGYKIIEGDKWGRQTKCCFIYWSNT